MRVVVRVVLLVTVLLSIGAAGQTVGAQESTADELAGQTVRVATKPLEPFVYLDDEEPRGYSIDVWNRVADDLGLTTEWIRYETVGEVIAAVESGEADVGIAGISLTPEREEIIDFSHAYFDAGLAVYVPPTGERGTIRAAADLIVSRDVVIPLLALAVLVVLIAHAVWWSERRHNPEFPHEYGRGISEAIWWSTVNVITGGEAVKDITRPRSRLLAVMWMVVGLLVMAYVTARITSVLTVAELQNSIDGIEDIAGQDVVSVEGTIAIDELEDRNLPVRALPDIDAALEEVAEGRADAVVYDAPILAYRASTDYRNLLEQAGSVFRPDKYGIALPQRQESLALKEGINEVLLAMVADGTNDTLSTKWFGGLDRS